MVECMNCKYRDKEHYSPRLCPKCGYTLVPVPEKKEEVKKDGSSRRV